MLGHSGNPILSRRMVEAIFTEILNPYRRGTPFEMFKNRFTSVLTCAFAASLALAGCAISGTPDNSRVPVNSQEQGKEFKTGVYTSNTKNGEKIDAQSYPLFICLILAMLLIITDGILQAKTRQ